MSLKPWSALTVAVAIGIVSNQCGGNSPELTFDLVLTDCPRSSQTMDAAIQGIIVISNYGNKQVRYAIPIHTGYEVTDSDGVVVGRADASAEDPTMQGIGGVVVVDPGSEGYFPLNVSWQFPSPDVPTGVYQVSVLLLNGDRTTPATVTVCNDPTASDPHFAVCNSPCADAALLAKEGITTSTCGANLTCGP